MDLYKWEVNGSCLWSTLGSEWTLALAPNSWWYLTVTLMTFSSDRQGPRVIPIRRTTPLQSARRAVKEPQPQPLPANLGMNYWKGQSWAPPWRKMELAERSNWHSSRTRGKGHLQHHGHLSYVSSAAFLQLQTYSLVHYDTHNDQNNNKWRWDNINGNDSLWHFK